MHCGESNNLIPQFDFSNLLLELEDVLFVSFSVVFSVDQRSTDDAIGPPAVEIN